MNSSEIENILRNAPQPSAPAGLRERLCAQAPRRALSGPRPSTESSSGWLRRWWPVLAPAAVSLASATLFTLQQSEIRGLKAMSSITAVPDQPSAGTIQPSPQDHGSGSKVGDAENPELARLKALAAQLNTELSQLEQMKHQNEQLRKELATRSTAALSPEETKALEEARDRASSTICVNNLKQLAVAVKMWSGDHEEITPPNVPSLLNYVGSSMKIFICPADTQRQAAGDANSFTPANCSYEYLAASTPDNEANRSCVLFRCPIHGHIGIIDGSVHSSLAKNHPESLVQREGRLYMQQSNQ